MTLTVYPSSYDTVNSSYRSFGSGHEADHGYNSKDGTDYCLINANNGSYAETKFYFKFNLSALPSGATINSVSCVIKAYVSSLTSISTATIQMAAGTTEKGTATNLTTSSAQYTMNMGTWTVTELKDAAVYIHYVRTNQNTTSGRSVRFYGATLTVDYTIPDPIPSLITDRTQADVDYARSLCAKGIANMTADELAEFGGSLKGMYNYTDLNRVETAVAYVAAELASVPSALVDFDPDDYSNLSVKTDWAEGDYPSHLQMVRYLANIKLIRDAFPEASIAWIPDSMDNLDYSSANNIEQLLKDIDAAYHELVNN